LSDTPTWFSSSVVTFDTMESRCNSDNEDTWERDGGEEGGVSMTGRHL